MPQHVLRFWESRFSQIRPVKRAGGRRFYRPEDVDLLRGIRALLYSEGFTIRGVQKLLKERGLRHVANIGRGASVVPEPVVVEKIVYVERPAESAPKKRVPHLRAVPVSPPPMSLPFFDGAGRKPEAVPVLPMPPLPVPPLPMPPLPMEERARLSALLDELQSLKRRLKTARC